MNPTLVNDKQWVNSSFMIVGDDLDDAELRNRFFSTASMKFNDTSPGGSFVINPAPQFTRSADIKSKSLFNPNEEYKDTLNSFTINNNDSRLGRYYSEAIDDNQQVINLRFGVAQFNSLTTYFTGFYSSEAGRMARTGRTKGFLYYTGRAFGLAMQFYVPSLLLFELASIMGDAVRFLQQKPHSKFYYMKPTMPMYWSAVTTIVNHLAILKGVSPRAGATDADKALNIGATPDDFKELARIMPDVFDPNGGVNVYGLSTRAQRKYRVFRKRVESELDNRYRNLSPNTTFVKSVFNSPLTDNGSNAHTLNQYIKKWMDNSLGSTDGKSEVVSDIADSVEKVPSTEEDPSNFGKWIDDVVSATAAGLDDGSEFISIRVENTGTISESFSNSAGQSDIQNKINQTSSSSRSKIFNFAGGNIADIPGVSSVVSMAKDVISGVADQLSISGLAVFMGGAFADIPKQWTDSTASLPRSTYTVKLRSPYGNKMSRFLNIDIPLAMLLAGALPLSTGKQSYTSPFLCQLFDQGRTTVRLGMIDSLSITRGVGNLGFDNNGNAMGIDVSFSIMDMSSIIHMPIVEGFKFSVSESLFDEDTSFSDYMAALSAIPLADQIYAFRKLKINYSIARENLDTAFSYQHFAQMGVQTTPGQLLSGLFKGTVR